MRESADEGPTHASTHAQTDNDALGGLRSLQLQGRVAS